MTVTTSLRLYEPRVRLGIPDAPKVEERCSIQVSDYPSYKFYQCSRKKKPGVTRPAWGRDGLFMDAEVCGFHASVYDRAAERWEQTLKNHEKKQEQWERSVALAETLTALGIEAQPHQSGKVLVDGEEVLKRLKGSS